MWTLRTTHTPPFVSLNDALPSLSVVAVTAVIASPSRCSAATFAPTSGFPSNSNTTGNSAPTFSAYGFFCGMISNVWPTGPVGASSGLPVFTIALR